MASYSSMYHKLLGLNALNIPGMTWLDNLRWNNANAIMLVRMGSDPL